MSRNCPDAHRLTRDSLEARKMEARGSQVQSGNNSDSIAESLWAPRKRKEYSKEVMVLRSSVLDNKRSRQTIVSSWPPNLGTVLKSHKGEACKTDSSTAGNKIREHSLGSNLTDDGKYETGTAASKIPGSSLLYGINEAAPGNFSFRQATEATSVVSICGSGPGYMSTQTTLNEEGDSKAVQSFGQTMKVVSQLSTLSIRQAAPTKFVGRHKRQRERRQSVNHGHGDGEVISPLSDSIVTDSSTSEEALNRILGVRIQDATLSVENSEAASLRDSGCSSFEAGKRERYLADFEYSESGKVVAGGMSQEHQSSSVVTDVYRSSSSDFRFSSLRISSKKRYRLKESLCIEETDKIGTERDPRAAAERVANDSLCIADEHMSRRSEAGAPEFSLSASRSSKHQQEEGSSSEDMGPQRSGDESGDQQQNSPHTFVLSSGRLSKDQQKQCGMRPTTIDDDFDRYFAQLML